MKLPPLVTDSSVIIDLCKTNLIEAMLRLDNRFVIPETMLCSELLRIGSYTIEELVKLGLDTHPFDVHSTTLAYEYATNYPALSEQDSFALALAKHESYILLSGDKHMRNAADEVQVRVHGTLWVCDQLEETKTASLCPDNLFLDFSGALLSRIRHPQIHCGLFSTHGLPAVSLITLVVHLLLARFIAINSLPMLIAPRK